jgi:hypothetical protein
LPQAAKLLIVVRKFWVPIPGEAPYILVSLVVPEVVKESANKEESRSGIGVEIEQQEGEEDVEYKCNTQV